MRAFRQRCRVCFNSRLLLGICWIILQTSIYAVLALCPGISNAQQSPTYQISGIVLDERGHTPVPGCHLSASPSVAGEAVRGQRRRGPKAGANESTPSTVSDAGGHFTFVLPSEGSWQIYASAQGFARQPYLRHEEFFSAVVLTPLAPKYELTFVLEPDSSIAGFVRDEAGDAVRNARVTLSTAENPASDSPENRPTGGQSTLTDDRGHYEFAGLAPGDYKVGVQGEPWYATNSRNRQISGAAASSPDSPLDVVYPETWFPGVTERRSAEIFSVRDGEVREADFDLVPIPATHLHINVPQGAADPGRRGQVAPQVERVSTRGAPSLGTSVQFDAQGQMDVDGLSPGLYRVTMRGPNGPQSPMFVRVPNGAQHTLDLTAAVPAAEITFHSDTDLDLNRVRIVLTDVDTDLRFSSSGEGDLQRRRAPGAASSNTSSDRKLEVPPGRYRVTLTGDDDLYLTDVSSGTVPAVGRVVTLNGGSTTLNLKLKRGRSTLHGTVSSEQKPLSGAMVMLVPASSGVPGTVNILRRDQTNTDGSFLLQGIIPGDYILLAIDGGWGVTWHDPSTLGRYLVHGLPVSLQPNANVRQDLVAQNP